MRVETIGAATLYLGDCLDVLPTLGMVDAVITDPPYGIGKADWDRTLPVEWFGLSLKLLKPHGAAYVFGDSVTLSRFQVHWEGRGTEWKGRAVWVYEDGPRNDRTWTRKHEDCLFLHMPEHVQETPKERSIHGDPRWGNDRLMGDVWRFPRVLGNYGEREDHPTQKPIALLAPVVSACTKAGGVVLDPFMGSGSTGVAALSLGRRFIGIELSPEYFDACCVRIEAAQSQGRLFA